MMNNMDHYQSLARDLLASPGVNRGVGGPTPSVTTDGAKTPEFPTGVGTPPSTTPPTGFPPTGGGVNFGFDSSVLSGGARSTPDPAMMSAARSWLGTAGGRDAVRSSIDSIIQNRRLGIPPVDNSPTYQELIQNLLAQFRSKQQGPAALGDLLTNGSGNVSAVM